MSRRVALLPFEISRWEPEGGPLEDATLLGEEDPLEEGEAPVEGDATMEAAPELEDAAEPEGEPGGEARVESEFFEASEFSETSEYSETIEDAEASQTADAPVEGAPVDGFLESDLPDGEAPADEGPTGDGHAWLARADRLALARWIREELAALLGGSRALTPLLVELEGDAADGAEELDDLELALAAELVAAAALASGTELGLACRLRADAAAIELSGLLADAAGEERVRFALASPLGEAHLLPRRAAREVLLALGEDAAVSELADVDANDETPIAAEAVLDLCRGARSLAEAREAPPGSPLGDPMPALGELLEAVARAPALLPARDLILRGAEREAGSASMPAWLAALEQLALLLPGDARTLMQLAAYRRLHFDAEGARELLLRARDLAGGAGEEAAVLAALASLAEAEGRHDEAVLHLRAATRLADDPALHLRLGLSLRLREPTEAFRSLQRAVVLAPDEPGARLELARQLQWLGETGRAATEAARAVQLAQAQPEVSQAAAELLRELLQSANG